MKQTLLFGLMAITVCCAANASDDGFENYFIGQSTKTTEIVQEYKEPQFVHYTEHKPVPRKKCSKCYQLDPVRVKNYTEVIEHYQVYKPVVIYQPAGTYSERYIIESKSKCNRCGY